ncbi:MAG TPA: type II secretion system F family protein [Anaeromyxobacteraceae bacterium]|jgi:tight adherence protein B|nr:type II secretion system F family protein [Anaeromyxobacteraceae bacterium]
MTITFAILCAVAVVASLEGLLYARRYFADRRAEELKRRLSSLGTGPRGATDILRRGRFAHTVWLDAALRMLQPARAVERLLEQSESRLTVAQVVVAAAALAIVAAAALSLAGRPLLMVVPAGLLAAASPFAFLLVARERRSRRLSEQLPDALGMVARSLRAGHALSTSFEVVATDMPQPISLEFARAFEEQRLGLSFDHAVMNMSDRAPGNGDLKIFAVSTIIQKETGGNLAEILDNIAATIRDRYRFYGKLRALTAEGRASGYILGALPFLVAVLMSFMNPEYFQKLFDNTQGQMILAYGIVSWVVGFAWMYNMTRLEV